jgi:hypothetical protein
MLVKKSFQAVANDFRSVVAQSIAQLIELLDKRFGGANGEDLVSDGRIVVHVDAPFLWF